MKRDRQARWDADNLRSVGTKLTNRQHHLIQSVCDYQGMSIYALIRTLLLGWLMEQAHDDPAVVDAVLPYPLRRVSTDRA